MGEVIDDAEKTDEAAPAAVPTKLVELQLALIGFGERWEHVTLDEAAADRLIGQGFAIEIQDDEPAQDVQPPETDPTPEPPAVSKPATKPSVQTPLPGEGSTVATGGVISPDKGTGGVTV